MERFDGNSETSPHRRREISAPLAIPGSPPSNCEMDDVFRVIFRNARSDVEESEDDVSDISGGCVNFRLSVDSGASCGEGDEETRRARTESVGAESGYGSPFLHTPHLSRLSADQLRSADPPRSFLLGASALSPPVSIHFPHRRMIGLFDRPAASRALNAAADSFRSIGTQTNDDDTCFVIDINHDDELDIDEDAYSVSSNLDDAFLDESEEVDGSRRGVRHLPDVVPLPPPPANVAEEAEGRSRAHSVSLPVSLLDFSEPRDVGRCLSQIASDFDQSYLHTRTTPSTRRQTASASEAPSIRSAERAESSGGFLAFIGRVRQRSQSASEAPSTWTNPSVPQSRSVATSAPPSTGGARTHSTPPPFL